MDELYRQELLEIYRTEKNKGVMLSPTIQSQESNPLCGDEEEIFIRLDKDGKIKDASFVGKGCVISMAATSILIDHIKGKTLDEIKQITNDDVLDLIGLNLTPSRVKCATLSLHTLKKGIKEFENKKEKNKIIEIVSTKAKQIVEHNSKPLKERKTTNTKINTRINISKNAKTTKAKK